MLTNHFVLGCILSDSRWERSIERRQQLLADDFTGHDFGSNLFRYYYFSVAANGFEKRIVHLRFRSYVEENIEDNGPWLQGSELINQTSVNGTIPRLKKICVLV